MIRFFPYGDILRGPEIRTSPRDAEIRRIIESRLEAKIAMDESVDYEDWMEPASMLAAAIEQGLEICIRGDKYGAPDIHLPGQACPEIAIGRFPRGGPGGGLQWPMNTGLANHYGSLISFADLAGRRTILCDMPGDREQSGTSSTGEFARAGASNDLFDTISSFTGKRIAVKQTRPSKAHPVTFVDVPVGADRDWAKRWFFDEWGFHFARFEGEPDCMLVQEAIDMEYETRFFVIGGRVVSGSACVSEFTPAMRDPANVVSDCTFATFERKPFSGDFVTNQSMAMEMQIFAQDAARKIMDEVPALTSFVIDVAKGPDGFCIIELNPADQAGLYANDCHAILRAIVEVSVDIEPQPDDISWPPVVAVPDQEFLEFEP